MSEFMSRRDMAEGAQPPKASGEDNRQQTPNNPEAAGGVTERGRRPSGGALGMVE